MRNQWQVPNDSAEDSAEEVPNYLLPRNHLVRDSNGSSCSKGWLGRFRCIYCDKQPNRTLPK
jgi:hypothetical protein